MEWTNQILEDMLRACTLKYQKNWDKSALGIVLIQQQLSGQHRDGTIRSPIWMVVLNSAILESNQRVKCLD
jgi:hypothetical protein